MDLELETQELYETISKLKEDEIKTIKEIERLRNENCIKKEQFEQSVVLLYKLKKKKKNLKGKYKTN